MAEFQRSAQARASIVIAIAIDSTSVPQPQLLAHRLFCVPWRIPREAMGLVPTKTCWAANQKAYHPGVSRRPGTSDRRARVLRLEPCAKQLLSLGQCVQHIDQLGEQAFGGDIDPIFRLRAVTGLPMSCAQSSFDNSAEGRRGQLTQGDELMGVTDRRRSFSGPCAYGHETSKLFQVFCSCHQASYPCQQPSNRSKLDPGLGRDLQAAHQSLPT